jgi:zona occludens toxin (predicted ATPase)
MIICFAGLPGSGKSYDSVKKIVDNLRNGRTVYTNIDGLDELSQEQRETLKSFAGLDDYEFNKRFIYLTKEQVYTFHTFAKQGSLIVIDEVHKWYSNREWNTNKNKEFADWASTHRHYGFDLILITQDVGKIESHVRSLIEWTYVYKKVNFLGGAVQQKYLLFSYSGDDCDGQPLAKNVRTYDPKYFKCYKSHAGSDVKELGFMTHTNILKHPIFYAIPVVICLTLYLVFVKSSLGSGDLLGSRKVVQRIEESKKVASAPPIQKQLSSNRPNIGPGIVPSIGSMPPLPVPPPPAFKPISSGQISQVASYSKGLSTNYIWTDKEGMIHISNLKETIPPGTKYKTKVL